MYDESTIDELNRLPLDEVMRNNGYHTYVTVGDKYKKYLCPFHPDKDPSFRVDLHPSGKQPYAGFYCYACGESNGSKGVGAVMLQLKLLEVAGEPHDFPDACKRLAKDFNVVLGNGVYFNHFFHRSVKTDPIDNIQMNTVEREFTHEELRALGCQIQEVTQAVQTDEGWERRAVLGKDGKPIYKYSWGKGFYYKNLKECNFDSRKITKIFQLYPLRQETEKVDGKPGVAYISRKKIEGNDSAPSSREVRATTAYPIFAFIYNDEKGWWAKKYEPYFKRTPDKDGVLGPSYKFSYWYQDNKTRDDLNGYIYGDVDVMRALDHFDKDADVQQTDDTRAPLCEKEITVKAGDTEGIRMKKVFDKLIICSGPRDGLSTYFHSDVHVCWPHSETSDIYPTMMNKLFSIANEVYVMYDIDKTGIDSMNRLALTYIELRVIYLPEKIKEMTDRRTGKPCKDAEQYFNNYNPAIDTDRFIENVDEHFSCLIENAKCMRFWDVEWGRRRTENNQHQTKTKYTINFSNLMQFLQAKGLYKYNDESGVSHFVYVKDNIVEVIEDKDILTIAKKMMKDFLFINRRYNNNDLSNAISTQKKIDTRTLDEIQEKKLDFMSWGKDFDYFFFKNCAVRVSVDSIIPQKYSDVPYNVNKEAIIEQNYRKMEPLFEISINPDYEKEKKRYELRLQDKALTKEERDAIERDFLSYERLWKYKLRFSKPIDKMPAPVQFVWDTCRIHWEKEAMGYELNAEEKQRQCMQFVNKAGSIGYVLSRYRTPSMQQMTTFTDYKVLDERKSFGGTGKTTFRDFLDMVRKVLFISGNEFDTSPGKMQLNFSEFVDTVHQLVFIDDLRKDIRGEEFKNITTNMVVRTLYKNKQTLPRQRVPKIFMTMNSNLDLDNPAVYRRCYTSATSDYYHPTNYSGTVKELTPLIKFGKDIINDATEEERSSIINLMLQFCQFYLSVQEVIRPPIEKEGMQRYLYAAIKEEVFIEWANGFFSDPFHYERPVSCDEMIISYLDFRGEDVTKQSIKEKKRKFKEFLEVYCMNMGIIKNPEIVYAPKRLPDNFDFLSEREQTEIMQRSKDDRIAGLTREKAWVTVFSGEHPAEPRKREQRVGERCYYFFKSMGDVPKDRRQLLPCTDEDTDAEK